MVYRETGSSLSMALTVAAEALSTLLLPLWGVWVDRVSPRGLMSGALLFQAGVSGLLPLGITGHWITVGVLYGVSFLVGTGANVLQTVQTRVIPLMFPDDRDAASVGLTTAYTVTTVVGPLLAGLALAHHGEVDLLWLNTASFAAPILLMRWTRVPVESDAETGRVPITRALREGVAALIRAPAVRPVLETFLALRLTDALAATLAVYRLKHSFHASDAVATLIFLAVGVGGVIGTRVPPRLRAKPRSVPLKLALTANLAGVLCLMSPWPSLVPWGLVLTGGAFLTVAVTRNLWLQAEIPVTHLARANTTVRTLSGTVALIGTVAIGSVSSRLGVETALAMLLVVSGLPAVRWLLPTRQAHRAGEPPAL
jgi:MFS family permease